MVKKKVKKKEVINKKNQVNAPRPILLPPKFGEKASDNLAKYAGSWGFILGFVTFILLWMGANIYAWLNTWDVYPFILLNLVLSCVAALQAPVILMSQNRAAEKDRQRAEYDYAVNRKAEREIQEIKKIISKIERKIK